MDYYKCIGGSIRHNNRQMIMRDKECLNSIAKMKDVEQFLSDFGFLSLGRDYVFCSKYKISLQTISTSVELTAGSIISSSESGCMADAYSLLRKYRDDLFFYLYIVVYDTCKKIDIKLQDDDHMEANIERWINNKLDNLYIGNVLQAIARSPQVKDAVKKYSLKTYFDSLGDKLNNYVHGKGVSFYNQNVNAYREKNLQRQLEILQTDMRSITITFLFVLTLCSPLLIMSTDYVDYLECDMTPPDGSQYWIAPFVTDYFKRNIDLIDESCIKYIKDNTFMKFE